jgi:hypothetical protein
VSEPAHVSIKLQVRVICKDHEELVTIPAIVFPTICFSISDLKLMLCYLSPNSLICNVAEHSNDAKRCHESKVL